MDISSNEVFIVGITCHNRLLSCLTDTCASSQVSCLVGIISYETDSKVTYMFLLICY